MGSEICLVLHRKRAIRPDVEAAIEHVRSQGVDLRIRIPWDQHDQARVVAEALADGATRVIAGGGDGSINAVVNALVGDGQTPPETVLGILPLGTANDFAHGCGLPVADVTRCLEIACTSAPQPIDVGCVNGRYFLNVASAGLGAEITATTPVDLKKTLGGAAYTIVGLMKVFNLEPYQGRLLVPGEEPLEGAILLMAVANNRLAGGGFEVAPQARLDDGLLDLAAVLHHPDLDLWRLAAELRQIDEPSNQHLYYRQLPAFTVESDRPFHYNLDGEPDLASRLEFSVLPKHLGVVF